MTGSWREKYLQALAEQETSERRAQGQIQQLRKCIQALAEAALGADPELDDQLKPLLSSNQRKSTSTDHVNQAAEKAVSRRTTREAVSLEALEALVNLLTDLNPSASRKRELKRYRKLLRQRVKNYHAYPQLLRELSALAQAALDDAVKKRPNWLVRLLGGGPQIGEQHGDQGNTRADTTSDAAPSNLDSGIEEAKYIELEVPIEAEYEVINEPEVVESKPSSIAMADPGSEPVFASIQDKITRVLQEMVDGAQVEPCVRQKFIDAKARLASGLNWYEVVATLEDIRDLFLQALVETNQSFEQYLEQVERALSQINQHWHVLTKNLCSNDKKQSDVGRQLKSQVKQLNQEIATTTSIESLKIVVADHIESLGSAIEGMDWLQQQTEQRQQEIVDVQTSIDSLEQQNKELRIALREQREKALMDALTGLPNRQAYNERSHAEFSRWLRYQRPLSIAVVDVDHFKGFNDTYGHQTGDRVLKIIAKLLSQRLREVDYVARYGGEEFVVLLPETEAKDAVAVLDQCREALAKSPFKFKDQPVQITASFGIAQFSEGDTVESVFHRADQALYQAKAEGRNRVTLAQ